MPKLSKFIEMGGLAPRPPKNLLEVLERGATDTYPLHMALWLFKNVQGGPGPFLHLPGPIFGYRLRDREARSKGPDDCFHTMQALSWLMCIPALGVGHLQAGPTALVYGGFSEGLADPPARMPKTPEELPAEVQDLLVQATFPLTELPALTRRQSEFYCTMKYFKYSCIFGMLEYQLVRRAQVANRRKAVPANIERDLQRAYERVVAAFDMPDRQDWEYDRKRHEEYIKSVRCYRGRQQRTRDACAEFASPYSPPFWGLPIFDVKPLYAEALRLVKADPRDFEDRPDLAFMDYEERRRLAAIKFSRMYPKGQEAGGPIPKNAHYRAAWDWIESLYGMRVRATLHPSDHDHKGRLSSPPPN